MSNASFLPEDYVAQTAERRTNIASLVLFGVVMTAVFGAFLVTNRQWTQVRQDQIRINGDTERAASEIRKMQELEEKRGLMVEKAELAMTLVEPVPRSVLLAMVVNAMPQRLSLIDFDLKSEEIKRPKKAADKDKPADAKPKGTAQAPRVESRGKTKAESAAAGKDGKEAPKPEPTRFLTVITMTGVAPSDTEVSRYMNGLSEISIFKGVRLDTTEEKDIDGLPMRQFKISFRVDPDADIRALKSKMDRPDDPMSDRMRLTPPSIQSSAMEKSPAEEPASKSETEPAPDAASSPATAPEKNS